MLLTEATREVIALSSNHLQRNRIVVQSELADNLPIVTGDRIQLQQVVLNLLRNASDAMADVNDRPRQLLIKTEQDDGNRVRVPFRDAGVGLPLQGADSLFDAFYTTKSAEWVSDCSSAARSSRDITVVCGPSRTTPVLARPFCSPFRTSPKRSSRHRFPEPIPRSDRRSLSEGASFVRTRADVCDGGQVPEEFDVVCLGGGVAGEAIAGEILGELALAIKLGTRSAWYAAYIVARERGKTSDEAARDATLHIEGARERAQV